MEILIKFNYDNKTYCVFEENKKVLLGKISDNKISTNLKNEEIDLIKLVLYKLRPSNDLLELAPFKLGNNKYRILYDKKTRFRIFDPIPNKEDNIVLNSIFNNFPLECYETDEEEYTVKAAIKKGIKIGENIVLVVLSSAIIINGLCFFPDLMVKAKEELKDYHYEQVQINNEELSDKEITNRITSAINENKNLSDNEKAFILSDLDILLDNKKYIDFNNIENILKFLEIKYQMERDIENVFGVYKFLNNCITVYDCNEFDEADKSVLSHELCHVYQNYFFDRESGFLNESLASAFNCEYYNYDVSYNSMKKYLYSLIEIIGAEPFKIYQFSGNSTAIYNELMKIINDEDKAIKLFENLDNYKKAYNDEENDEATEEIRKEIYSGIKEYYEIKFNRTMEDDLVMLYYLDRSLLTEKLHERLECDVNSDIQIQMGMATNKCYFNTKKTNSEDNYISIGVEQILNSDQYEEYGSYVINRKVILTDDNRYQSISKALK